MESEATVDISVDACGSVTVLTGLTEEGREWLAYNTQAESWQWNGPAVSVEPRMASDIIEAAEVAGLEVAR